MDFESLRLGRRRLQEFCTLHNASVGFFHSSGSYRLHAGERDLGSRLRHLTSTATCLESLQDCPDADVSHRIQTFARRALRAGESSWASERSAKIYSRCRALPLIIQHSRFGKVRPHLKRILAQLKGTDRFAIGEADAMEDERKKWYPPNAYHTFWTLEILQLCSDHFGREFERFERAETLDRHRRGMVLWAWQVLGCQVALHKAASSALDTDQLAWALATVTRFPGSTISPSSLRYRDLLSQAIDTFFQAQDPTGAWHHHAPLFHYTKVGNAYCYIFETLTPLLKSALRPEMALLRDLLRPNATRLLKLLQYADRTKILLDNDRCVGWSSGHRTNQTDAESWATAAVFGCMQALRRLFGVWTQKEALQALNHPANDFAPKEALATLTNRGNTWSDAETVADQLLTMFVHPIQMRASDNNVDPDDRVIAEEQMRSAILFGPPGTSKTTLARAVAAAVCWEYVELHPSHFVAAGLPNVQRTADEIFTKLMELDRCVVLFDEIDELVRERQKEPDAFGRFLTTSMLPKLAELWKQRRIIYFVATNHVAYFDSALTKSAIRRPNTCSAAILHR